MLYVCVLVLQPSLLQNPRIGGIPLRSRTRPSGDSEIEHGEVITSEMVAQITRRQTNAFGSGLHASRVLAGRHQDTSIAGATLKRVGRGLLAL